MDAETIEARIMAALTEVRPYLQADGGDVKMLRFRPESGRLELAWIGTCAICPLSLLTLRAGVERTVMHLVPEVKRVEAIAEKKD
jgi:Fe-S cluster biogenesis protein NfuA